MKHRLSRLPRAIYFPPVMAVAVAAAALSALPMLDRVADENVQIPGRNRNTDCRAGAAGCALFDSGQMLENIQQVYGILTDQPAKDVDPESEGLFLDF